MKIVIPYKKNDSMELCYAIQSYENINHDGVVIIGEQPDYEVQAEFIQPLPNDWSSKSPYHDVLNKYLTACEHIEGDFIISNDDFFTLPNAQIKNYNRGTLTDHIKSRYEDFYTRGLKNTREALKRKGYGELSFELHVPMIVNSKKLKEAIEEIIPLIENGNVIMIRSYYGNKFKVKSEYMEDIKNKDPINGFMSSNESTFKRKYGDKIRSLI